MNFYKSFKITIFLVTGILLACSPDQQQQKNTNNIQMQQGLKVYIDPVTGEFLDAAPQGYNSPDSKSAKNNQTNANLNATQNVTTAPEEKDSSTPGGGTFIKMPKK
ncbi:MAG: hypothetical protein ACC657_17900 [Thiohalomonadales bacterium]